MTYQEEVQAAAADLKQGEVANWRLAKRTFANTFANGETGRGRDSLLGTSQAIAKVPLAMWCEDVRNASPGIKFSYDTGRIYRRIWATYGQLPEGERPSWTEAYRELGNSATPEDRERRAASAYLREAPAEERRQAFLQLAHDPEVATPATIDAAAELLGQRAREVRGMPPVPPPMHPEQREAIERQDALGVGRAIGPMSLSVYVLEARAAADKYAQELRRIGGLSEEARRDEAAEIDTVINAWTRLRQVVSQGTVAGSADAFLASLRQSG